jgi:hypothetical protein
MYAILHVRRYYKKAFSALHTSGISKPGKERLKKRVGQREEGRGEILKKRRGNKFITNN